MKNSETLKKEILDEYYRTGIITYTKTSLWKRLKDKIFPPKNPWLDDKKYSSSLQKSLGIIKYNKAIDKKIIESKILENKINDLIKEFETDRSTIVIIEMKEQKFIIRLVINLDLLELKI